MDQEQITYQLKKPFPAHDGMLISSLTLRELKVKDMRDIGIKPGQSGIDACMKIVAYMNNMPAADLDEMYMTDANGLIEAAAPFLGTGLGEKPSPLSHTPSTSSPANSGQ